jgi:hypothetical protein
MFSTTSTNPVHRLSSIFDQLLRVSRIYHRSFVFADYSTIQNYTQNIDTLETLAGVGNVLQCHGSFATASCLQCRRRVPGTEIEADIMRQKVAVCPVCHVGYKKELERKKKEREKKRGKNSKKAKGKWDSEDEDESDEPEYPPGIMKVCFFT